MRYFIVPCDMDLDSIISTYAYYEFIIIAGFDVKCFLNERMNKKIEEVFNQLNVNLDIENTMKFDDNIILLNKTESILPKYIDKNKVTEIISLKNGNFSEFSDANLKIESVSLLSTLILERYREYEILPSLNLICLLNELYKRLDFKLTGRDKIIENYINLLYENRSNIE